LLQARADKHKYLIVTCNRQGKLATRHQHDPTGVVLVLDDVTCDRSLVMTSSFTNMVWAARSLALIHSPNLYCETTDRLAELAGAFLFRYCAELSSAAQTGFRSVIYLGSGVRLGAARESALKMLEMTAGQVTTFAESYLGVRHGPLSAILPDTLLVCFLSADPLVRAYELDLIRELNQKKLGMRKLVIGDQVPADVLQKEDLALECPGLNSLGDENAPLLDAVAGQLLAFYRCLSLGLSPDSPSRKDVIRRVVGAFTIHRKA
jgi:tagatose-6-phosphate ketose/aldose isomerase